MNKVIKKLQDILLWLEAILTGLLAAGRKAGTV